jgi:hypothetical protein
MVKYMTEVKRHVRPSLVSQTRELMYAVFRTKVCLFFCYVKGLVQEPVKRQLFFLLKSGYVYFHVQINSTRYVAQERITCAQRMLKISFQKFQYRNVKHNFFKHFFLSAETLYFLYVTGSCTKPCVSEQVFGEQSTKHVLWR